MRLLLVSFAVFLMLAACGDENLDFPGGTDSDDPALGEEPTTPTPVVTPSPTATPGTDPTPPALCLPSGSPCAAELPIPCCEGTLCAANMCVGLSF